MCPGFALTQERMLHSVRAGEETPDRFPILWSGLGNPFVPAKAGTQCWAKDWMPASAGKSGEEYGSIRTESALDV
jgi:hypothetical protein